MPSPPPPVVVRDATVDDAAACAAIYAPYVTDTAISFETQPPSPTAMAERIAAAQQRHCWLVAEVPEDTGQIAGYAYAGPFAAREAYRWSCEVSVYLAPGHRGRGIGRRLYEVLLPRLTDLGFRVAVAKMSLPNEATVAFHAGFGFAPVGVHRSIGHKLGRWHDVMIAQRFLGPPPT